MRTEELGAVVSVMAWAQAAMTIMLECRRDLVPPPLQYASLDRPSCLRYSLHGGRKESCTVYKLLCRTTGSVGHEEDRKKSGTKKWYGYPVAHLAQEPCCHVGRDSLSRRKEQAVGINNENKEGVAE